MDYKIKSMEGYTLIEVSGIIERSEVLFAASRMRSLDITYPRIVILDVDMLEDEREMFYHTALINIVKKEVEHAGGVFKLKSTRPAMRSYLAMTGLDRIFSTGEAVLNLDGEAAAGDLQRC
ncbi:MAG TPA: hypothetical protein PK906_16890 [Spirochaetota bacterium]|nr:hypothetical protein [Spirochaetota bacterium]